jgi:F-type H+/Na+-transporting ATPase subunit alpha
LKQPQFKPYPIEEQVVVIYAGTRGYLDPVPVDDVNHYEAELLDSIRANGADILEEIRTQKDLTPDIEAKLKAFLDRFAKSFS